MNALTLDTVTGPDGTVTFRVPESGRFLVHIEATWQPLEIDRKAAFEEARRRGHPDVIALLERVGEDAIANPNALLLWGTVDDPTLERPPQPPYDAREPVKVGTTSRC